MRASRIPGEAVKATPQTDDDQPKLLSLEYADPVPVPGKVNTAGAEDSAFILPDGNTLYFFFTQDLMLPVEKQVLDSTVGIYVSKKIDSGWSEPETIVLQDPWKLAMEGAEFVQGNLMYFYSAREGYMGVNWFKAEYKDGKCQNWQNANQILKTMEYATGELQISGDGKELHFHSHRSGGEGGLDIWVSQNVSDEYSKPVNIAPVNTENDEGWPALSPNGDELWFSRDYGVWRSLKVDEEWHTNKEMFSPLAGEPSIDSAGKVYFTHHFFKNSTIIKADIYIATREQIVKGVSLTSRGFQQNDFLDFFEKAEKPDSIITWARDWSELNKDGGSPEVLTELAAREGLTLLIEVTPHSNGVLLRPLKETTKQNYKSSAVAFAQKYRPA